MLEFSTFEYMIISFCAVLIGLILIAIYFFIKKHQRILNEIKENNTSLEKIIETLQGGVITYTISSKTDEINVISINKGWQKLTGYTMQDIDLLFGKNLNLMIIPEDREKCIVEYKNQTKSKNYFQIEYRIIHKDSKIKWVAEKGYVKHNDNGLYEIQSVVTDMTEIQQSKKQVINSEKRFRISTEASNTAIFEFDAINNRYTYFENALKVIGIEDHEVLQRLNKTISDNNRIAYNDIFLEFVHNDDKAILVTGIDELNEKNETCMEIRILSNKEYIWCRFNMVLIKNDHGSPISVFGAITNIDETKKQTEHLFKQAKTDQLTGLYNRFYCEEYIKTTLKENPSQLVAVLLIDIDNFKTINDTKGHIFGDMVLVDVAARLKNIATQGNIVARIGGDEFLAFISNVKNESEIETIADKICRSLNLFYGEDEKGFRISCSVGYTIAKNIGYSEFINQADLAMYESKYKGKNIYSKFSSERTYTYFSDKKIDIPILDRLEDKKMSQMVFDLLYSSTDFTESVNLLLSFICNTFGFNHSYIFETIKYGNIAINTFEWTTDGVSELLPTMEPLSNKQMLSYEEFFKENRYYYSADISSYEASSQNALDLRKINAIIHFPLLEGKELKGIIGFGKTSAYDKPTDEQIEEIYYSVKILSVFINRHRVEGELYNNNQNKADLMNRLPVHVYVTDNEHRILFMNNLMKEQFKNADIAKKCYEVFMSADGVCDGCPKLRCGEGVASSKVLTNLGIEMISTTKKIMWDGKSAFIVTCLPLNTLDN